MKAEILAVGTELLLGDIINTNAQYISQKLALLGIEVYYQSVVGDNTERLLNAYKNAFERADLVITTGGLGPTDDDLTKETAAKYFKRELVEDVKSIEYIKEYFKSKDMPQSNLKQGYIPRGAQILPNENGTAPGCIIEENSKILIMLPGPPNEMIPMFEKSVIPILKTKQNSTLISRILRLSGIGESAAAEKIKDLMNSSLNPTIAPYAKTNEMIFRITASGKNEEEAKKIIQPVVNKIYDVLGDYIYGEEDTTLSQEILKILIKNNLKISVSESCTGGLLASELVNFPGASKTFIEAIVTYSNESKIKRIGVNPLTLEKYGAVSEQTAIEMAKGIAETSGSDIGLSITGIAGPDGGNDKKPVGLVYIGVYINGETTVRELNLRGSRIKIRQRAVSEILNLLRKELILKNIY